MSAGAPAVEQGQTDDNFGEVEAEGAMIDETDLLIAALEDNVQ